MAGKFYAIKKGFDTIKNEVVENVILTDWGKASQLVQGINKAKHGVSVEYKSFKKREDAEDYLNEEPYLIKEDGTYPKECLHCYVDGSFKDEAGNYSYGLVCVKNDEVLHFENGLGNNKDAISMRQIGGELLGALKALIYARDNNYKKMVLFFDYKGVCLHGIGYWDRDNEFSEQYYQWVQKFMKANPDIEVVYCKTTAHSLDDYNELADGFAKKAINIKPDPVFFRMVEKYHLDIQE